MQLTEAETNTYSSQSRKTIKPLTNEWLFLFMLKEKFSLILGWFPVLF